MTDQDELCARIGKHLAARGQRLAIAESLTGGMVSQGFAAAPDASDWFLGGVVAYSKHVKFEVLAVPHGPVVTEAAATAMAQGVRQLTGADVAAGVTGAGGPEPQDGQPPGTVWMAVVTDDTTTTREVRFDGDPPEVCAQATAATIELLAGTLGERL